MKSVREAWNDQNTQCIPLSFTRRIYFELFTLRYFLEAFWPELCRAGQPKVLHFMHRFSFWIFNAYTYITIPRFNLIFRFLGLKIKYTFWKLEYRLSYNHYKWSNLFRTMRYLHHPIGREKTIFLSLIH